MYDTNPRGVLPTVATELQYLCHHCGTGKWSPGGPSTLGKHLAQHGGAQTFPNYVLVDAGGYELNPDGARRTEGRGRHRVDVRATTNGMDGWVRSRRAVTQPMDGARRP